MWDVIFKKIPQFLFEPIAVTALLGLLLAAICFWKKRTLLYWLIIGSLIFLIGWRVVFQIYAARYACILIFPATIACSYICFKVGSWSKFIPHFPPKLTQALPALLVITLAIVCVCKVFRINTYNSYIKDSSEIIKQDAQQFSHPFFIVELKEYIRFNYYLNFNGRYNNYLADSEEKLPIGPFRYTINIYGKKHDAIYFILDEPTNRELIIPQKIKINTGYWQLISRKFQNRKRKKELRVYRWSKTKPKNLSPQLEPEK